MTNWILSAYLWRTALCPCIGVISTD